MRGFSLRWLDQGFLAHPQLFDRARIAGMAENPFKSPDAYTDPPIRRRGWRRYVALAVAFVFAIAALSNDTVRWVMYHSIPLPW